VIASIFAGSLLDLAIGGLEAVLALVLMAGVRSFRRTAPLLAAFAAFFALRAGERLITGVSGNDSGSLSLGVDLVVGGILVVLVFTVAEMFGGLELTWRAARWREREYERALTDYRRLARHRIANPLAAIVGSAQALRELPNLEPETRRELVDAIIREAKRLEAISLEPHVELALEEQGLEPEPRLDRSD
jgi:signal transduction histidine kinase